MSESVAMVVGADRGTVLIHWDFLLPEVNLHQEWDEEHLQLWQVRVVLIMGSKDDHLEHHNPLPQEEWGINT
jgi:hypothetical protein